MPLTIEIRDNTCSEDEAIFTSVDTPDDIEGTLVIVGAALLLYPSWRFLAFYHTEATES